MALTQSDQRSMQSPSELRLSSRLQQMKTVEMMEFNRLRKERELDIEGCVSSIAKFCGAQKKAIDLRFSKVKVEISNPGKDMKSKRTILKECSGEVL